MACAYAAFPLDPAKEDRSITPFVGWTYRHGSSEIVSEDKTTRRKIKTVDHTIILTKIFLVNEMQATQHSYQLSFILHHSLLTFFNVLLQKYLGHHSFDYSNSNIFDIHYCQNLSLLLFIRKHRWRFFLLSMKRYKNSTKRTFVFAEWVMRKETKSISQMGFIFSYSNNCIEDEEKIKTMIVGGRVNKYNRICLILIRDTRELLFDIILIQWRLLRKSKHTDLLIKNFILQI